MYAKVHQNAHERQIELELFYLPKYQVEEYDTFYQPSIRSLRVSHYQNAPLT